MVNDNRTIEGVYGDAGNVGQEFMRGVEGQNKRKRAELLTELSCLLQYSDRIAHILDR